VKRCQLTTLSTIFGVAKIISGAIWENRLGQFFKRFDDRRREFEFALTIHSANTIDDVKIMVENESKARQADSAKLDQMMGLLQTLVSPEEQQMKRYVAQKGGIEKVRSDKGLLMECLASEPKAQRAFSSAVGGTRNQKINDIEELWEDVHSHPDEDIAENLKTFAGKFDILRRQIEEDTRRALHREGDRIIGTITSGPHDRIIDPVSNYLLS